MRFNRWTFVIGFILASCLALLTVLSVKAQEIAPISEQGLAGEFVGGVGIESVGCTRTNTAAMNAVNEQRVVELINIERAKVGLPPVKRNSELDFAARDHSRDMVEDNYFAHETQDWVNGTLTTICGPFDRIKLYYSPYSLAGEILTAGFGTSTPESAVVNWMNSAPHKAIMLDSRFKEIGVGFYSGSATYTNYWSADFGSQNDVYPVIINNEAMVTTNPNVSFYVYGKGVWSEMRTRDNSGNWTNWMPYQENVTFQLTPTNGTHTLSVELRAAGSVVAGAVSSDTIDLAGLPVPDYPNKIFLPFVKR